MAAGPKGCTGEARLAPYSHRLNSYRKTMVTTQALTVPIGLKEGT